MLRTLLLPCVVLGAAFGLQLAPAWAITTDGQEDICATSAVIVCDNFENRSIGVAPSTITGSQYKNTGWAVSNSSMAVVNTQAYDGTKSLEWTYPAGTGGAGYFDMAIPARRDYYVRFYMKNESNWLWSDNGNKMVYIGGPTTGHNDNLMYDQGVFGGSTPAFIGQYGSSATTFRYPNINGGYQWPLNEWVCVEFHATMNSTPGGTDGSFEGWINGQQKYNHTGLNLDTIDTTFARIKFSGYFNAGAVVHPTMRRWIDNIVVSTQRIGCLGTPITRDSEPPAAPVNLSFR